MSVVTLSTDLQSSDKTVPDWIQLLPAESEFTTEDNRTFVVNDLSEIINNSLRERVDIYIDYEHSILENSKDGKPAAGWVKELITKENTIWARVEWTPKATQMILNKEYRYISPVLATTLINGEKSLITRIINVALTNHPALEMSAFCNSKKVEEIQNLGAMSQIAQLMNIETCSAPSILKALQKQQSEQEIQACTVDVDAAISTYIFPRACEDDLLTMRKTLGQEKFQALTQKLSLSGMGATYLNGQTQTQTLKRGVSTQKIILIT